MLKLRTLVLALSLSFACLAVSCESSGYDSDSNSSAAEDFPNPETSLVAAIKTAQGRMTDGRCVSAGLGSSGIYTVTLVGDAIRREVSIDPKDGKYIASNDAVVGTDMKGFLDELAKSGHGIDALAAVNAAAKEAPRYWPLAVELGREKTLVYQVLLARGKRAKVVRVNPVNGAVQSVEDVE